MPLLCLCAFRLKKPSLKWQCVGYDVKPYSLTYLQVTSIFQFWSASAHDNVCNAQFPMFCKNVRPSHKFFDVMYSTVQWIQHDNSAVLQCWFLILKPSELYTTRECHCTERTWWGFHWPYNVVLLSLTFSSLWGCLWPNLPISASGNVVEY